MQIAETIDIVETWFSVRGRETITERVERVSYDLFTEAAAACRYRKGD
jgi:hypothetical protein